MITTKDWNIGQPSRKLGEQAAGPYPIVEKVGHAYCVQLPIGIKVYPVFAPEKLYCAASTNPLLGQIEDPQPPIEVNGQEEQEVDKVLAIKLSQQKLYYCICWIRHDEDLIWYPASNFKNSLAYLCDFYQQYLALPGPPKRLDNWLQAAENDKFLPDNEQDNWLQGWQPRQTGKQRV